MKVLTAAEMQEVDRLTIGAGIPGLILMENAGSRVVDFLLRTFAPLEQERVVVICGKGNNGGDGFVVARQLWTRTLCRELTVIELYEPTALTGDAAVNRAALEACGCPVQHGLPNEPNAATIVVDAILGTGLTGPARGAALSAIRILNERFPAAQVVALDIPSGLPSEEMTPIGAVARADYTVTFTAAKRTQILPPAYQRVGQLTCVPIGTPPQFCEMNPRFQLNVTTPDDIRALFKPRPNDSNKGLYGHVLVVGGLFR